MHQLHRHFGRLAQLVAVQGLDVGRTLDLFAYLRPGNQEPLCVCYGKQQHEVFSKRLHLALMERLRPD